MKEELYINGEAVDLDESVNITLNYKSNMLTDLSKIVGNNSYTIKLPKTQRNLGIIGCADMPGAVSSFPRVTHDARYFRNGVEIVSRGKAVLLAVNESIEVVLTWGSTTGFLALVEEGKNLTDFMESTSWIPWNDTVSVGAYGATNIMYSDIDFGLKDGESKVKIHPSVRVSYLFSLIGSHYGLRFEFSEDRSEFISRLILPLLTRNGGYANRYSNRGTLYKTGTDSYTFSKESEYNSYFEEIASTIYRYRFTAKAGGKLVVTPSFFSMFLGACVKYGTDTFEENTVYLQYEVDPITGAYFYNKPVEIDINEGDMFVIWTMEYPMTIDERNAVYSFGIQPNEIQFGDRFPIIENLPDIKIIDFIKAIASMCGVFAVPSLDGDLLKFVPFDLLSNRSRAVDWSDNVMHKDISERPRNVGYVLEDFAQNNKMLYKEDDNVPPYSNSNIVVGDKTLEEERDAVTLPFAPSVMRGYRAKINLYEYNDGEPELQNVEPRILIEKNVGGLSTGVFDGLDWSTLINNYYSTYQNTIKTPVVITENVLLDEFTLRDMDLSIPVYLRQYGRYYAVVEVKAPSNGVCECKLLQLD